MKTPKRPVALMTLAQVMAQVICALAILLTIHATLINISLLFPNFVISNSLGVYKDDPMLAVLNFLPLLRDLPLGACLVAAEIGTIRLCGRMKKSSTISEANVKGLGRIAKAIAIAGGITLLFGNSIVPFLLTGLPSIAPAAAYLLLPFMLLTVALMIRTVQLLMRRALDMQDENELTV